MAYRLPQLGNYEIWGYVGGEYGGGSWTIERPGPIDDQVDINDVRAFLGWEWMGPRRVTGFFEFGYVFGRKLVYKSTQNSSLSLKDTIMLRSGFAF